jgi:transposase
VQHALQAMALGQGIRRGATLWSTHGQAVLAALPLLPHATDRRDAQQALYRQLDAHVEQLDTHVRAIAQQQLGATLLMTHSGVGPVTALATDVFLGDASRFRMGKRWRVTWG